MASSRWKRGLQLNNLQCKDCPPEQSMLWPQMSAVSRPRRSGLTDQDFKNASIILLARATKLRTVLICHQVFFQLKKFPSSSLPHQSFLVGRKGKEKFVSWLPALPPQEIACQIPALSRPSSWPALHLRLLSVLDLVLGAEPIRKKRDRIHDAGGAWV